LIWRGIPHPHPILPLEGEGAVSIEKWNKSEQTTKPSPEWRMTTDSARQPGYFMKMSGNKLPLDCLR
jgi:hypothetical protein